MTLTIITGCSLLLQAATIFFALRLISITGWRKAWILLSVGITSMGIRRFITFIQLLNGEFTHEPGMGYEIVGLLGSALMLAGVILIKPIFAALSNAEREQRELVGKLQDAMSKIKILSGMMPICANCKKIRNDKGYWEQIEIYIRDRSDADFTHSICPECAKKLYPDYYKKIQ